MSAAALSPAVAAAEHGRIPVLDIGAYLAGDTGAAAPLARAIARTCEDTGFLVVANHGVPPRLVEDTFAVAVQFFARPEPEKLALKIGQYNIGYLPFGGQVVRHSPVNRNTKPNFSESFYITRDRAPDHPDSARPPDPELSAPKPAIPCTAKSAKRGDHLRREELQVRLCPARRQPGWQRPRIEVGDRHFVRQVADHAYRGVRVDHLKQSALLQRFLIVEVRGKRLKAASLKPYRVIVDLINDVIGRLGKSSLGIVGYDQEPKATCETKVHHARGEPRCVRPLCRRAGEGEPTDG